MFSHVKQPLRKIATLSLSTATKARTCNYDHKEEEGADNMDEDMKNGRRFSKDDVALSAGQQMSASCSGAILTSLLGKTSRNLAKNTNYSKVNC